MGKLRFPKEKPEIALRLDEAVGLMKSAAGQKQALSDAYSVFTECAAKGSPRGAFLKACILYADEAEAGDHREEVLSLLDTAERGKYPLASGIKADYLSSLGETEALYALIRKAKGGSPQALYYEGAFLSGYLDPPKGAKKDPAKACVLFEKSARAYLEYEEGVRRGVRELADVAVVFQNPYCFSAQAGYAYQLETFVYSDLNVKANLQLYLTAYANAMKYGNPTVRYRTAAVRVTDCMNNVMGMHSLKTVNALLDTLKKTYAALDGDVRENLKDHYDAVWEEYDEFYEYETERLKELGKIDVYTSADYARQDSLLSDFAQAVQTWSENRPPKTEYSVTVGNKEYKVNDLGEMVDEYGQSNGLRVDVTSKKVYDSHSNAVGFFDSFGEFHQY